MLSEAVLKEKFLKTCFQNKTNCVFWNYFLRKNHWNKDQESLHLPQMEMIHFMVQI